MSGLATIDPRVRLLATGGFALVVVGLGQPPALLAALALAVLAAVAARVRPGPTLRRLAALDGFMVFVLVLLPFSVPGEPVVTLAGHGASSEGLWRAADILLKSNAVALMVLALLGALEPVDLGHALARLRLPERFVLLFLFTVRSIALLGREYHRLRQAMRARGFIMRCDRHSWQSLGYLFGMMMVRSLDRSERTLAAMRCRGFTGRFPSLIEPRPVAARDHAFAALFLAAGLILIILEHP
ncbi:MAG: cobalt ECF transporter T component CbiQ [Rhodospirillaceae bacterium]